MCQTENCESVCFCESRSEAKKFLDVLVREGSKIRCDETVEGFKKGMEIPEFYDKEKFKRGQNFFHKNIFAMLYAKLLGLISDLSLISSQKILEHTNQSSEPKTAYKRYVSTIFSMYTWYSYDLTPGSKSWDSLKRIRTIHNFTSLKSHKDKIGEIAQYHMALAQFGFMGLIVSKPEKIGIYQVEEEDMESFVHFWRVIGHMLGIEERYNICRSTYKETKEICDEIIEEIIIPEVNKWDETFLKMTKALIDGMWAMIPILHFKVFINLLYYLLNNDNNDISNNNMSNIEMLKMGFFEKFLYKFVETFIILLRFDFVKNLMKHNTHLILFLTHKFPFLAYYKYGINYKHSKFVESSNFNY